ncbi:hypothetical protein HK102_009162, partial [Quaeritorhiza haematococci]
LPISEFLLPDFASNGLGYVDLFMDKEKHKKKIRRIPTKCTLAFSLLEAKNISIPFPMVTGPQSTTGVGGAGSNCDVIRRHVRISLLNKADLMSNVHTVAAVWNPAYEKTWKFSSKASLLFPKDDENTCFVRTHHFDINLCIVFEMCCTVRVKGSAERWKESGFSAGERRDEVEISCGWGVLPIVTPDGGPIENKTYQIKLYAGTPFDWVPPPAPAGGGFGTQR